MEIVQFEGYVQDGAPGSTFSHAGRTCRHRTPPFLTAMSGWSLIGATRCRHRQAALIASLSALARQSKWDEGQPRPGRFANLRRYRDLDMREQEGGSGREPIGPLTEALDGPHHLYRDSLLQDVNSQAFLPANPQTLPCLIRQAQVMLIQGC